jgi:hypothetical protein
MRKKSKAQQQLHLVTAEEASAFSQTELSPVAPSDEDAFLGDGIRRYQELQRAFDEELFGKKDLQKLAEILPELQLVRERLAAHGVRVRV